MNPYQQYDRQALASVGGRRPPLPLEEVISISSPQEQSILSNELTDIYWPLAQLIGINITAAQQARQAHAVLLSGEYRPCPYIIGLAGSVAAGKSTAAALLRQALKSLPGCENVALVTTDGFLHPNATLIERGLLDRKGFPESYDHARLIDFLQRLKSGESPVEAPVYSHVLYDVLGDQTLRLENPSVVIVEGVNVLQPRAADGRGDHLFASDLFDYSIYLHAEEPLIKQWYTERFLSLIEKAKNDPAAFYHRFVPLSDQEQAAVIDFVWTTINGKNLNEHILPGKPRADLILHKGADHRITHFEISNR